MKGLVIEGYAKLPGEYVNWTLNGEKGNSAITGGKVRDAFLCGRNNYDGLLTQDATRSIKEAVTKWLECGGPAPKKRLVLVTGGAGFIGSHLCDRLIANGELVICLDDFSTGRAENVAHLVDNFNFRLEEWDVTKPFGFEDVDQIYNLACPASPVAYQANPTRTMKTSVLGAINALDLAYRCKARILQTSTSEVYGDPKIHPQPEKYWGNVNPIGLRACYDEGKRAAECLFMDYHRQHNVDVRIVRIFNTYGPRMQPDDGRVISNFIRQALNGEDLTVYGNGHQTRSFCYVSDMVDGLIKMMNTEDVTGPINLGNADMEYNITEVAERIIQSVSTPSKVVHRKLPSDDPKLRRPNLSKAEEVLDWAPKVPFMSGIVKTIQWFQGQANTAAGRRSAIMDIPKRFPVIQGL